MSSIPSLRILLVFCLCAPQHALRAPQNAPCHPRRTTSSLGVRMVLSNNFPDLNSFIEDYEFPAAEDYGFPAEAAAAAPPDLAPLSTRPRKSAARKPSKSKKPVTREDMLKAMSNLGSFIDDYEFPSQPSAPPQPSATPVPLPVGKALTQIEADADAVFAILDFDGDGFVSMAELGEHLRTANYAPDAIDNIFQTVDADANGSIDQRELRDCFARFATLRQAPGLLASAGNVEKIEARADEVFDRIKREGDGPISPAELLAYFAGTAYSEVAVGNIFSAIDADADGEISRAELRDSLARIAALRLALGLGPDPPAEYGECRYLW